jgi:3'-phosphoadenosine 5'-phosphosulfate sulfotransferase (PAPS reductase)/FAD synthetase
MDSSRIVVWFSCGAASAVAAHLTIQQYRDRVVIVYCDTLASEHPDNARFLSDIEKWLKVKIVKIRSEKYETIDDVFENRKYMSGPRGAICTVEMKKIPRFNFQQPDDVHVFGFTIDEQKRADRFQEQNPELSLYWPLIEAKISKRDCFDILKENNIELPKLYSLGFKNNNCIGCVKATSLEYWQKVKKHFPDIFELRSFQSLETNTRLLRIKGERLHLCEMPEEPALSDEIDEDLSCGPQCSNSE